MKRILVFLLAIILLLPFSANPAEMLGNGDLDPAKEAFNLTPNVEVATDNPAEVEPIIHPSVPILMYHVLEDFSGKYEQLYVQPQDFRKQLEYLYKEGYQTVNLQDILAHWTNSKPLPAKPIVLTFDDGYPSMYRTAFPLLKEFGFKGTFFLHTAKINTENGLSTAMILEMSTQGMEIGSHTISHPDLTKISASRLKQELISSKQFLEKLLGKPVQSLAYPSGSYNGRVLSATGNAGYLGAVTTQYGFAESGQNPFALKRIRINKSDGLEGFITKLKAADSL